MQIQKTIELDDGSVEVSANLSPEQVQFLIEVGLNVVLAKGAKPFIRPNEHPMHDLHDGSDAVQ